MSYRYGIGHCLPQPSSRTFINSPSPQKLRDPCKRGCGKIVRATDGGWHQGNSIGRHSRADVYMNSQRPSRPRPAQARQKSYHKNGKWPQSSTPIRVAYLQLVASRSRIISLLFSGMTLGISAILKGRPCTWECWPAQIVPSLTFFFGVCM